VFSFATDLGGRIAESFPEGPIDGPWFWRIVAGAHPKISMLLRHGLAMDEVLYRPGKRFPVEAGVPALLHTALPHLSNAPEQMYDALAAVVAEWPWAPVARHYRALFDLLAASTGRTAGSSAPAARCGSSRGSHARSPTRGSCTWCATGATVPCR
jgi:putative sulfotransferase